MPLIGDQQDDDRIQIADLVVSGMSQTIPRISSSPTVRSTSGQPVQVLQPHIITSLLMAAILCIKRILGGSWPVTSVSLKMGASVSHEGVRPQFWCHSSSGADQHECEGKRPGSALYCNIWCMSEHQIPKYPQKPSDYLSLQPISFPLTPFSLSCFSYLPDKYWFSAFYVLFV